MGAVVHSATTLMMGLIPVNIGRWTMADATYLMGMALLAAALVIHAGRGMTERTARTIITISAVAGGLGGLVVLGKSWLLMMGSNADWKVASTVSGFIVGVLPFALAMASGIVMYSESASPVRKRVGRVARVVVVSVGVVALAAWVPRLIRLFEVGGA